jgi:amidase
VPEDAKGWRLDLDAGPPIHDPKALRVATVFDDGRDVTPIAAEVMDRLRGFAGGLSDAGLAVDEVALPVPLADGFRSWQDLVLPIIGTGMPDAIFSAFAGMEDVDTGDPILYSGKAMVSRYRSWAMANDRRQRQRMAWASFFERYDVALAPVMPTAAFPHDTERSIPERRLAVDDAEIPHLKAMVWCGAIGSALLPVVTVPTGLTPSGLPVGVQLVGPYLSDRRLLAIARLLDEIAGQGFLAPPLQ